MKISDEQNTANMRTCPAFNRCSRNLCPLDYDLDKRRPKGEGPCKYMCEPKKGKKTVIFTSGEHGRDKKAAFTNKPAIMPPSLLKNVPKCNVKHLSSVNKEAWYKTSRGEEAE